MKSIARLRIVDVIETPIAVSTEKAHRLFEQLDKHLSANQLIRCLENNAIHDAASIFLL